MKKIGLALIISSYLISTQANAYSITRCIPKDMNAVAGGQYGNGLECGLYLLAPIGGLAYGWSKYGVLGAIGGAVLGTILWPFAILNDDNSSIIISPQHMSELGYSTEQTEAIMKDMTDINEYVKANGQFKSVESYREYIKTNGSEALKSSMGIR